ncbi:hypothetical protein, partial [Ruegeria arenilitoris]|uniref:hypothetical protein n=1 Tax=Ruegeria arenilitoris TaxID=1173585 RepID=UPI001C2CC2E1
ASQPSFQSVRPSIRPTNTASAAPVKGVLRITTNHRKQKMTRIGKKSRKQKLLFIISVLMPSYLPRTQFSPGPRSAKALAA